MAVPRRVSCRRVLARPLLLSSLSALPFLSPPALAQAVYGSIAGTVTEPAAPCCPASTVTITSVERKTVDTVVTDENGRYTQERLLPGAYEVGPNSGLQAGRRTRGDGRRRHADAG